MIRLAHREFLVSCVRIAVGKSAVFKGIGIKAVAQNPLIIFAALAVLAVLVILMVGIGGFAAGTDFNRKHANKIMRLRVAAQALAVASILIVILFLK